MEAETLEILIVPHHLDYLVICIFIPLYKVSIVQVKIKLNPVNV